MNTYKVEKEIYKHLRGLLTRSYHEFTFKKDDDGNWLCQSTKKTLNFCLIEQHAKKDLKKMEYTILPRKSMTIGSYPCFFAKLQELHAVQSLMIQCLRGVFIRKEDCYGHIFHKINGFLHSNSLVSSNHHANHVWYPATHQLQNA